MTTATRAGANPDAPLVRTAEPSRPILWADGRIVALDEFLGQVRRLAATLPRRGHLVNLCEHRDRFLTAYCAALVRGHINLLPPSRAPLVIEEVAAGYEGSYRCDDRMVERALASDPPADEHAAVPRLALAHVAEIAFTSGSTGAPKANVKRWRTLLGSTEHNAARIRESLAPRYGGARPWIVATVPPQHMYGTEISILLPLAADMAVHAARPLFPADVAAALAEVPAPRVLVTTPVHLRALVTSGQSFPEVGAIVSATAPLDQSLAAAAERTLGAVMLEMFGSTETCVIATRRTAREDAWHLYPGVSMQPSHDGATVEAPWFDAPTLLQDIVELVGPDRFIVRGRNADMIEVAGKRASLFDLTRRLLAIPGVEDAVVFQPDVDPAVLEAAEPAGTAGAHGNTSEAPAAARHARAASPVRRVVAFVVAPELAAEAILAELGRGIDPAFLPRPLKLVPSLPRNEVGKLSRDTLLALAAEHLRHHP